MTSPFGNVLVPYDGSAPSQAALGHALALGRAGAKLTLVHVVDVTTVVAQSATALAVYDPSPLLDALDDAGRTLLADATQRCTAAGLTAASELVHEQPVAGIAKAADAHGCDLIAMGTHARSGVSLAFVGSTTVGVLRDARVPVLTVRAEAPPEREAELPRRVLLALDDSEPAEAAAVLTARLATALGSAVVACGVADTRDVYDMAATYGYDPLPLTQELVDHTRAVVERTLAQASLAGAGVTVAIVQGEPVAEIIAQVRAVGADLVVVGSHGRRGLRRLLLGSVAEHLVRVSPAPVLVVRTVRP